VAHPIARAWFSSVPGRGGQTGAASSPTGAQNYDEFADDTEITAVIAANPSSALAIEMPHRAPRSVGKSLRDCLGDAASRLAEDKAAGRYRDVNDAVGLYRICSPDGSVGYGLWCMVDTSEISTKPDEPGLVIRNEDVFQEKVAERVALAQATRHLLSGVLLLQTGCGDQLHAALAAAATSAGQPTVVDTDPAGRVHEVWAVGRGETRDRLLALAGGGELVVADGNHRSLAAQVAGLPRFLAVVTTPDSVVIRPYNRLVSDLHLTVEEISRALVSAGATVTPLAEFPERGPRRGTVVGYFPSGAMAITLPHDPRADPVDNLDHAVVERILLGEVLGLEPGDKRISYVGGDYTEEWLWGEVSSGRAAMALVIAPVTVDDFVAVNLARRKMPRKSTWFTPKARAGLVLADLAAEPSPER
jgi:uncharacterized protein (DUF1015 family)